MKAKFTLVLALFFAYYAGVAQQLPNASFDSWTVDTLAPDGWATYSSIFGVDLGLTSKDAADYVVGPYSIVITSDSVAIQPSYGVLSGALGLGEGAMVGGPVFNGAPFTNRPDTLFLIYKYSTPGADTPVVALNLLSAGSGILGNATFGLAFLFPASAQWGLGYAELTPYYLNNNIPDTLKLEFYSSTNPSANGGVQGSELKIDGVLFGYVNLPNGLKEIADKLNISMFPNPVADKLTITMDEYMAGMKVYAFDMAGKVVSGQSLVNQVSTISVADFATGTYIFRVADKDGNIIEQTKVNVTK